MIVVTGATGNVGFEVLKQLLDAAHDVRAAVTDIQKARQVLAEKGLDISRLEFVKLEFGNAETYLAAFAQADGLFLMRPPAISDTKKFIHPAIDAASAAGIERIAFLSLQGAEKNPVVPHYSLERHLEKSGMTYTFLRAAFFMQNLSTTHREDIAQHSDIFIPAGQGKTAFIDVRDIAAVAVKALSAPHEDVERLGLKNQGVELTGSEALGYQDIAAILSEVLGRPITYGNPSNRKFGRVWKERGYPLAQILVMEALYTVAKLGLAGRLTPATEQILGRAPITFRQFAEDYKHVWK
ncbi:MAG: NmrA family NAD(P)-binding protein [Trueperaceae bacterium]